MHAPLICQRQSADEDDAIRRTACQWEGRKSCGTPADLSSGSGLLTGCIPTSMRPGLWPAEVTPGCEMVRAKPACRSRVLMSSSLTLCPSRSDAQFSRSLFGVQNGAPRQRAGAELCGRDEGELARAQRSRPLRTLAARLAALRAPVHEKSSDFGLLCAQVCT